MDYSAFNYAVENKIPQLVDDICRRLLESKSEDPFDSVLRFLSARREGCFLGGCALAGRSAGGGWLRIFSDDGSLRASVDKLPVDSEGGKQLLAACGHAQCVFFVGATDKASPNTLIRKFSFDGDLLDVHDYHRVVACIGVDTYRHHLWVLMEDGGGIVVDCCSRTCVKEIDVAPCRAVVFTQERESTRDSPRTFVWLLTRRSIEKREADSLRLEFTINLPDSISHLPTTLVSGTTLIWCASGNFDSACDYCLAFESRNGQPASQLVPPTTSAIATDLRREGTWHLASESVVFMNEAGRKVITDACSGRSWRRANICVDKGCGLLWIYSSGESLGSSVSLYNPYTQKSIATHHVPDIEERERVMLIPI